MTEVAVRPLVSVDQRSYRSICELLPQLTPDAAEPSFDELAAIVASPCTTVFVALDGETIVGMLTLVMVSLATGRAAHVEDVVVDERARGKGAGRLLLAAALAAAAQSGARHVDLTSRSTREAANRLYQSLGFERRDTNLYRYSIGA